MNKKQRVEEIPNMKAMKGGKIYNLTYFWLLEKYGKEGLIPR